MAKLTDSRHSDPFKDDGDLDGSWIDDLHRRMFLIVEHDLALLEHARMDDPKKDVRETLDLLERALRVRRLMSSVYPKRARKKRNGAARTTRKNNGR